MADVSAIFKAYDVRGLVPSQLDADVCRQIGQAFADEVRGTTPTAVVIGHDMRASSPALVEAFSAGVRETGTDVVHIGLAATDQLYFASGQLGLPGAMFTASHNPAGYNGIKLCRADAVALSATTGLDAIRQAVEARVATAPPTPRREGRSRTIDVLPGYVAYLHDQVPVSGRRLKVVVDAGNGMAGLTVPAVFATLDVELVPMYFELDGSFPHHEANPLDPQTLVDLQARVQGESADLGLAFDGDADRCFAVDEQGAVVPPSAVAALIAERALAEEPGAYVIHNLITSRAVPELIIARGGIAVRTPVGHSLIKATMAEHNAVFGGEHSGHFYFRDFWYADSGMLAALHLLAAVAASPAAVSDLMTGYSPYTASGEINSVVAEPDAILAELEAEYADQPGVQVDRLDGLTVIGQDWWFNVRASNTEPVVRLNVEAVDGPAMADVRDHVLSRLRREQ